MVINWTEDIRVDDHLKKCNKLLFAFSKTGLFAVFLPPLQQAAQAGYHAFVFDSCHIFD